MREGDRLLLSAASQVYARHVGRIELGVDEGLTGWVARNQRPAFIREGLLDDPRVKYVPELEEERFQSMVAVPVPARSGGVIGVVVLHTAAPREFDEGTLDFLSHTASLVAGAIENARLYEESRRRVDALTALSGLSQQIAAVTGREQLYRVVCAGTRAMLGAERCEIYLATGGGRLEPVAADPARPPAPGVRGELTSVVLSAGDEELGMLTVTGAATHLPAGEGDRLLRAVANQVAVALKKAELIERLAAENLVRDVFEALAAGSADVAAARAHELGCELDRPHVVVHAEPLAGGEPWPRTAARAEAALRRLAPGACCDAGRQALRALLPLTRDAGELRARLDDLGAAEHLAIGVSAVHRSAADGRQALLEAAHGARTARGLAPQGGAMAYADLGAYRYLVHVPPDDAPRDRYAEAVERLLDYDERRRAQLVPTLEEYLRSRTRAAATARALFIHPNTLRQRLTRMQRIADLDLEHDDLLSLELAVKLGRLRRGAQPPP
jgi:GAF domain-containing protein